MAKGILIDHVFKVFGDSPEQALELVRQGFSKKEILAQTGQSIGVFYGPKYAGVDPANGDALYYEADGFSIRTSAAYRDAYLTAVPATNAYPVQDAEGTNETLFVDLSASYNFNDNLTVSFEALNLTDEFNDQFIDTTANREVAYTHTGRQIFLGARYKF